MYFAVRYLDENRLDSVDIHPRRFQPGVCARNFTEESGGLQAEQDEVEAEQDGLEDN